MNEDEMGVDEPLVGDELEQVMARYARVRLDPSPAGTRRVRAAVMEEAWRRHLAAGTPARGRRPFAGWTVRRLGATLAAASMAGLLLGSSVFAASRAGGPLYGTRLALEEASLPSDADARLEAEIAIAQSRIAEVVDAASRGDQRALEASLVAYEDALESLEGTTGAGAERALAAIRIHREVLEGVLARVPLSALAGINQAISRSDALIDRLDGTTQAGEHPSGSGANPGGNGAQGTQKPGATPKPGATARPDHTPRADRTPKPERTPRPERTREPRPTPDAGETGGRATPKP